MSETFFFTRSDLENMTVVDLKKLADYFKVKVPKNSTKEHLLDLVEKGQVRWLEEYNRLYPSGSAVPSTMSARVQRIYESMKKEN